MHKVSAAVFLVLMKSNLGNWLPASETEVYIYLALLIYN